jgi:hypothetical protein
MAGDHVIDHILDERAADLQWPPCRGRRSRLVRYSVKHPSTFHRASRDAWTRGTLRYSPECVE